MTQPTPSSSRPWWIVAAAFAGAWILYLAVFGPRAPGDGNLRLPSLKPPAAPARADYHWTLSDLQNSPVGFAKFEGKALFVNIWATWCPPCVMELPSIVHLAENPRLKDVAFVCISTDRSADEVKSFLRGKDWPMTVLRASALPEVFQSDGIPATYLVAPDGTIASAEIGAAQWDDPSVVDFLEKLARPAGAPAPAAADGKP